MKRSKPITICFRITDKQQVIFTKIARFMGFESIHDCVRYLALKSVNAFIVHPEVGFKDEGKIGLTD